MTRTEASTKFWIKGGIFYPKETSVCINADSPLCADFVDSGYGCNLFEREE